MLELILVFQYFQTQGLGPISSRMSKLKMILTTTEPAACHLWKINPVLATALYVGIRHLATRNLTNLMKKTQNIQSFGLQMTIYIYLDTDILLIRIFGTLHDICC